MLIAYLFHIKRNSFVHPFPESEEESQYSNILPKTVTWAQNNEERLIDSREELTLQRGKQKTGDLLSIDICR